MTIRPWDSTKLILGRYLQTGFFNILRLVFGIFQTISWKVFGIEDVLRKNEKGSKPVAQAVRILASNMLCMLMPPSLRDFICTHDEYVDPEYVITNDNISLFFLDPNRDVAVFGEGKEGQRLWHSDCDAFFILSMFKYSKRLILMPMAEFHKLCAQLPDPNKPIVIMGNTGRSGSTLLTQIFECTNKVISYSEPYPLNDLGVLYSKNGYCAEVQKLTRSLVKMYLRPLKSFPNPEAYLMKPTGPAFICAEPIKKVFPNTTVFYLFRNMDSVTKSIFKLSFLLPSCRLCYLFLRIHGSLAEALYSKAGFPSKGINRTVDNDYCNGILQASITASVYKNVRKNNKEVHALLFDDLLKDKKKGVKAIFKVCGLSQNLVEDAMTAFTRDSQRNTMLSKEAFAKIKPLEYTQEDKEKSNEILLEFGYPPIDEPCILDGTLDFDEVLENDQWT